MNSIASIFVTVVSLVSLVAYIFLLFANSKLKEGEKIGADMGHAWDGIREFNNPLPKWWFWSFLGCTIWAIGFVFYYPALGNYEGLGKRTDAKQYEEEVQATNQKYDEYFASITQGSVEEMAENQLALKTGRRLFLNNCAVCHGSDGVGSQSFPNLTDKDWLYGGDPTTIMQSIANGRNGLMPAQSATLMAIADSTGLNKETIIDDTVEYVMSLSGRGEKNPAGEKAFLSVCSACHTPAGTGMAALGAPNLTDDIWLYDTGENTDESIRSVILRSIEEGNAGVMPPHKDILSEEKIKTLAAYVYALSNQ